MTMNLNHYRIIALLSLVVVLVKFLQGPLTFGDALLAAFVVLNFAGSYALSFIESKNPKPNKTQIELEEEYSKLRLEMDEANKRISSLSAVAGFMKQNVTPRKF